MDINLTINIQGEDTDDLLLAIDEIKAKIDNGFNSGFDSNTTGSYQFNYTDKSWYESSDTVKER